MNHPTGLRTRIERLEEENAPSGVVGFTTGRGGEHDPIKEARTRRRIAELQRSGHHVVYFANLAGCILPSGTKPIAGTI